MRCTPEQQPTRPPPRAHLPILEQQPLISPSPRSAMDSGDAEGAELPPVDAEEKNMVGAGKKRRVERAHDSCATRGVRGAGAGAMDSDHSEGAESRAAAMEKARQEAEVALIRVAGRSSGEPRRRRSSSRPRWRP